MDLLCILLYSALGILGAWFVLRYVLIWIAPFLLAFLTASFIEPAVSYLSRRFNFRRGFSAAVCSLLVLSAITGLLTLILSRAFYELYSFLMALPDHLALLPTLANKIESLIDGFISSAPEELREYLVTAVQNLTVKAAEIPTALTGKLLNFFSATASAAPRIILFAVTFAVGVFFISSGYRQIVLFIKRQLPQKFHAAAHSLKHDLSLTLVKYLKAQVMLMLVTFLILTAAFLLLRIDYAVLLALMISFIDALPVLGVGTVLIPWALVILISGNTPLAIGLVTTYCTVCVTHSGLEPKLVGSQLGLHPAATLLAMYVGFCATGILGMILFPIILITVKQLNDKGYLHIWK